MADDSHAIAETVGLYDLCEVRVEYKSKQACPEFSLDLFLAFVA